MGKASKRKKEIKEKQKKKIRRFNYNIPLIAAGIGLFTILYVRSDYTKRQTESYVVLTEGEKRNIVLTEDEIRQVYQTVKPITDSLAKEIAKKGHIVTNIDVKVRDRKPYFEFIYKDISDKINQAKETIDHALQFWKHPLLSKPIIKFIISNNPNEIEKPTGSYDIINIYPLKDTGSAYYIDAFFITKSDTFPGELAYRKQRAGLVSCKVDFIVLKDSIQVNAYRAGVKWNLGLDEIDILETPALEVLHYQLAQYTHELIRKKVNELYKKTGELRHDVSDDYIYHEELITHGIGQLWFEQYNKDKDLGYIIDSLYNRKGMWGNKDVRAMKEKIRNLGIEKAIDLYIDNPDILFNGI